MRSNFGIVQHPYATRGTEFARAAARQVQCAHCSGSDSDSGSSFGRLPKLVELDLQIQNQVQHYKEHWKDLAKNNTANIWEVKRLRTYTRTNTAAKSTCNRRWNDLNRIVRTYGQPVSHRKANSTLQQELEQSSTKISWTNGKFENNLNKSE